MRQETLYRRVGRRYQPVAEMEALSGIPEGWWLVHVQPGCTSSRRMITPDYAEFEAAARVAEKEMVEAMHARCALKPDVQHVPEKDRPRYKRAYEAWRAIIGEVVSLRFEGVSMADVVAAGIDVVRKKFEEKQRASK